MTTPEVIAKMEQLRIEVNRLADILIGQNAAANRNAPEKVSLIQTAVSKFYGISLAEMLSRQRTEEIVIPRMMAMKLCRDLTRVNLCAIGRFFGGKDHGTVIHAVKRIAYGLDTDPQMKSDYTALRRALE